MNNLFHPQISRVFLLVFVMFITTGLSHSWAQVIDPAFRGDPRFSGARGAALGGALGSDAYDIETLYWNPAGINTIARPGIMASHRHDWDLAVYEEGIAARLVKSGGHALAASVRVIHAGSIGQVKDLKFRQFSGDIAYAYELITDFSFGILAGVRMGSTDAGSTTGYSMSLGILYSPSPSVSYGLTMRDLGRSLEYLPQSIAAGARPTLDEFRPAAMEISSTLRFPSKSRSHFLQILVAVEHNMITKEYLYRGGLEVLLTDFLAARLGYVNAPVTQANGGLGLMLGRLELDYAIMPRKSGAARFDEWSLKYFL